MCNYAGLPADREYACGPLFNRHRDRVEPHGQCAAVGMSRLRTGRQWPPCPNPRVRRVHYKCSYCGPLRTPDGRQILGPLGNSMTNPFEPSPSQSFR